MREKTISCADAAGAAQAMAAASRPMRRSMGNGVGRRIDTAARAGKHLVPIYVGQRGSPRRSRTGSCGGPLGGWRMLNGHGWPAWFPDNASNNTALSQLGVLVGIPSTEQQIRRLR